MLSDNPYTHQYYESLAQSSRLSAQVIVPRVIELVRPKSVIDIGCGIGDWLAVFKECGVSAVLGVDGEYIDEQQLQIERHEFVPFDLRQPLYLNRVFDLVMSVEVAEHLPGSCAGEFVDALTRLGPVILFSAAIPLQGGEHHVNEQWPAYWVDQFHGRGYVVVDCLRWLIWNDNRVAPWYAQNLLLFVRATCLGQYPALERAFRETDPARLALIHPGTYRSEMPLVRDDQTVYQVRVEVTQPFRTIFTPPIAQRLRCVVELEGEMLGTLDLPIFDGHVAGYVLSDAIAARFAWTILGRFFERTVYRQLKIEQGPLGMVVRRGDFLLATIPGDSMRSLSPSDLHNLVGWAVLLQELWERPGWPVEYFYDPDIQEDAAVDHEFVGMAWVAEISRSMPDLEVAGPEVDIILTVGGVALGTATLVARHALVHAQEIRAWFTIEAGFELCCIAVREGLLGRPLADEPASLRERLQAAAGETRQQSGWFGKPGAISTFDRTAMLAGPRVVFGRRAGLACGTSGSRRASLPVEAVPELIAAAAAAGDPIVEARQVGEQPLHVIYAPELIYGVSRHVRSQVRKEAELVARAEARAQQQTTAACRAAWHRDPSYRRARSSSRAHLSLSKHGTAHASRPRLVRRRKLLVEQLSQANATPAVTTSELPILRYTRIAPEPRLATARYQVTPDALQAQLAWLREAGYYSVTLDQWRAAMVARRPLPGRAIVITFDGAYQEFQTHAWPLLKHYGFSATVLVSVDTVGKSGIWDRVFGEEVTLLSWEEISQLQEDGVQFGSLSATYYPLTALSFTDVVREAARARATLERALGNAVRIFGYPYGDTDEVVMHLIGGCGYSYGLSGGNSRSTFYDSLLALPRIDMSGFDDLSGFISKMNM